MRCRRWRWGRGMTRRWLIGPTTVIPVLSARCHRTAACRHREVTPAPWYWCVCRAMLAAGSAPPTAHGLLWVARSVVVLCCVGDLSDDGTATWASGIDISELLDPRFISDSGALRTLVSSGEHSAHLGSGTAQHSRAQQSTAQHRPKHSTAEHSINTAQQSTAQHPSTAPKHSTARHRSTCGISHHTCSSVWPTYPQLGSVPLHSAAALRVSSADARVLSPAAFPLSVTRLHSPAGHR